MTSRKVRAVVASSFLMVALCTQARGTQYGVVMDGPWSDSATWTPIGGPPGMADDAFIGLGLPDPALSSASVTLDTDPVVASVSISNGTLDLDGNALSAGALISKRRTQS